MQSIKLKNQFRTLDEHEVEFLDTVLSTERAQAAALRKETSEQLELFRKQQEQAHKVELVEESNKSPVGDEEHWTAGPRKRKREKEAIRGVKIRKSSSAAQDKANSVPKLAATDGLQEAIVSGNRESSGSPRNAEDQKKAGPTISKVVPTEAPVTLSKTPSRASVKTSSLPVTGLGLDSYSSSEDD